VHGVILRNKGNLAIFRLHELKNVEKEI